MHSEESGCRIRRPAVAQPFYQGQRPPAEYPTLESSPNGRDGLPGGRRRRRTTWQPSADRRSGVPAFQPCTAGERGSEAGRTQEALHLASHVTELLLVIQHEP